MRHGAKRVSGLLENVEVAAESHEASDTQGMAPYSIHALHSLILGPLQLVGGVFDFQGCSGNSHGIRRSPQQVKYLPSKLDRANSQ